MSYPDTRQANANRLSSTQAKREARRLNKREKEPPMRPGEVRLATAYPQRIYRPPQPSVLEGKQWASIPRQESHRTYWGRSLDLVRIEMAIRGAHYGMMRQMTDLGRETLTLDGHASGCLQKRINRVGSLPWMLDTASGAGTDKELAEECRTEVEKQLKMIRGFKQSLKQLAWAAYDGRAALEIDWHYDPSQAWPMRVKQLHWIHPRRVSFGSQRQLQIIDSNREYSDFVDAGLQLDSVPLKFVKHTPQLFNDYPEREGLLPRILYWSFFGRFGVRERMILLEIFGKPWRIGYQGDPESPYNDDDLIDAFEQLDALGGTSTAILPRGMKADVPSPAQNAGQIHGDAIEHAQLIISKLVLGSTSTTDAQPAGLGSNQADVHKSEEDLLIEADGESVADAIEDCLTDAIVIANRGPSAVINAPVFRLAPEERADPEKELKNAHATVSLGVPVALAEIRERSGYRPIQPGEPYLQMVSRPASLGAPAPPPQPEIVWPAGKAPPAGALQPQPDDDLGDLGEESDNDNAAPQPGGEVELDAAGSDPEALEERRGLAAKMTDGGVRHCEHGRSNKCTICGIERVRDLELDADGSPVWAVQWRAIGDRKPQVPQEEPVEQLAVIAASWKRLNASRLLAASKRRTFQGIPIVIDRPKGTVQTGKDRNGNDWERTYSVDYGYIPRTEGGDGEALDVFVGDNADSTSAFWVRQVIDGKFDEYKLFLGFAHSSQVEATYAAHIPKQLMADVTRSYVDQVKALVGVQHEGRNLSQRLNSQGASECPHGKRRKCLVCGVVKSRQGAPWRAL